jgi:hypothetical protein
LEAIGQKADICSNFCIQRTPKVAARTPAAVRIGMSCEPIKPPVIRASTELATNCRGFRGIDSIGRFRDEITVIECRRQSTIDFRYDITAIHPGIHPNGPNNIAGQEPVPQTFPREDINIIPFKIALSDWIVR